MRKDDKSEKDTQSLRRNTRSLRTTPQACLGSIADASIFMCQFRDELLQVVVAIDFDPRKTQQRVVKAT